MTARRLLIAVACLALTGCYSFSTLARARTVAARHVEVWAAPEALVVVTGSGAAIRPIAEAGVRYGLTDSVELDARISTFGVTLGPRVQLLRSASTTSGFDIAIAPAFAWSYPDKLALEAPVLFGWNLEGGHQLIVTPRLVYQLRLDLAGGSTPLNFVYLGASVGIALRLTPEITLLPEVSVLGQIYADSGFASNLAGGLGMQGAIGLLIDPDG